MPSYDYFCESNGRTVEVRHSMRELLGNWGELCARAGIQVGDTPIDRPVTRLVAGGQLLGMKKAEAGGGGVKVHGCATGCGCH